MKPMNQSDDEKVITLKLLLKTGDQPLEIQTHSDGNPAFVSIGEPKRKRKRKNKTDGRWLKLSISVIGGVCLGLGIFLFEIWRSKISVSFGEIQTFSQLVSLYVEFALPIFLIPAILGILSRLVAMIWEVYNEQD